MSILGNRVLRREDPKFLTVGGTYVADLDLPGALVMTFVRASVAHAKLRSVDVSAARATPGVVAVYTNEDLNLARLPSILGMTNEHMTPFLLASDTVRYVGEPIVAVVAESREVAADAAERVIVDYDPLPAVVDPEEARRDENLLFPEAGTNTAFALDFGGDDDLFSDCEVVVEQAIVNQRVAACPLEVRSAAGRLGEDGRLILHSSTQAPHSVRDAVAGALAVAPERIHVDHPDAQRLAIRYERFVAAS